MTSRRRGLLGAVAVLLALAIAVPVVLSQRDARPRATAGDNVAPPDSSGRVVGLTSELVLPTGRYRVTLGPAIDELPPACCLDEPADLRPPEGGSFVGVEVTLTDGFPAWIPPADPAGEAVEPTFTLVVEDTPTYADLVEYPVTAVDDAWDATRLLNGSLQTYVAVDDVPSVEAMSLRVGFDGVDQELSPSNDYVDEGDALALRYSEDGPRQVDCGEIGLPRGFRSNGYQPSCGTARWERAWVQGPGWAAPGDQWSVVVVGVPSSLTLERAGGRRTIYYSTRYGGRTPEVAVTLGGREPGATWRDQNGSTVAAFDTAPNAVGDELAISVTYDELDTDDPDPVDALTVTYRSPFRS